MREMHKWKDKVELSLDNRQIFFLFFGLSVVGCFVFALGVMTGRRVDWGTTGEVAATGEDGNGAMALLDPEDVRERLSFKDGLAVPATDGLPPTRDPATVGLPEEKAEPKTDTALALASAGKPPGKPGKPAKPNQLDADDKVASGKGKSDKAKSAKSSKPTKAAKSKSTKPAKLNGKFTLQMKAFSRADQAEAFAGTLRANGHTVRVEAHEVKGRIWHRVRVGAFKTWAEGLAAKDNFEKNESTIAYVVRI